MTDIIRLHLFKHGGKEFFRLLSGCGIPIELKRHVPGSVMASGEIIEIVKTVGGLSVAPSLAAVIVQWLKNRGSRKIMIQTKDQVIVSLEGSDANEEKLKEVLEIADSVSVIQTEPDEGNDA